MADDLGMENRVQDRLKWPEAPTRREVNRTRSTLAHAWHLHVQRGADVAPLLEPQRMLRLTSLLGGRASCNQRYGMVQTLRSSWSIVKPLAVLFA